MSAYRSAHVTVAGENALAGKRCVIGPKKKKKVKKNKTK